MREKVPIQEPDVHNEIKTNVSSLEERGQLIFFKKEEYIKMLEEKGLHEHIEAYEKVCAVSEAIREAGGRSLLVGGSVRDMYFGKIPKDYDLEMYTLEQEKIKEVAGRFGTLKEIGESFGIIHLPLANGMGIDMSLPRTDSKIKDATNEHTGFDIKLDPNMSIKEAAKRRDFTMNSLAADPLTGELFDHYGGLKDIENKVLKATDMILFADDACRVLRGLQFISRFDLKMETETEALMTSIVPRVEKLAKSRIREEWKKLLLKGDYLSEALDAAKQIGLLEKLYPELEILSDTPQDKEWHPEGDVWIHTKMVLSEAKKVCRRDNLNEDQSFVIMLSALAHDLGKPATTVFEENGRITSRGHEQAGEKPAKRFLESITDEVGVIENVIPLVVNHMTPGSWYRATLKGIQVSDGAVERLARKLAPATIQQLVWLCEADHRGRGLPGLQEKKVYEAGEMLTMRAEEVGVYKEKPHNLFSGKDLIALGFKPGKSFGILIEVGRRLRGYKNLLQGLESETVTPYTKEEALALVENADNSSEAISILKIEAIATMNKIRSIRKIRRIKNQ